MKKTPIIELLLESEGYVPFDEKHHNRLHFNLCRLVKDEVRSHKWIEAKKGRDLSWDAAVGEWMDQHFDEFIDAIIPPGRIMEFLKRRAEDCFSAIREEAELRAKYSFHRPV